MNWAQVQPLDYAWEGSARSDTYYRVPSLGSVDSVPLSLSATHLFPNGQPTSTLTIIGAATLALQRADGSWEHVRAPRSTGADGEISRRLTRVDFDPQQIAGYFITDGVAELTRPLMPDAAVRLYIGDSGAARGSYAQLAAADDALWKEEVRNLVTVGFLSALFLYFAVLAVANRRRRIYLFYAGCILAQTAYWSLRSAALTGHWISSWVHGYAAGILCQVVWDVAYALFIIALVGPHTYPRVNSAWRSLAIAAGVLGVACFTALWFGVSPHTVSKVLLLERGVVFVASIATMVFFLSQPRTKYVYPFVLGSSAFILGALCTLLSGEPDYFRLGVIANAVVFSIAAGTRVKDLDDERARLELRTTKLELELARTEDTLLRAQMNPHFIANVVDAVRSLVIDGESDKAYHFLSKFAHVVQECLSVSQHRLVPLARELKVCESYVDLERLRFERDIRFDIKLDPGLRAERALIPPLTLQPLIENALRHGLASLTTRPAQLTIRAIESPSGVHITVQDNGIGRRAARQRSEALPPRGRASMAIEMVHKRFALRYGDAAAGITMEDHYDAAGQATGTTVHLVVPTADQLRDSEPTLT